MLAPRTLVFRLVVQLPVILLLPTVAWSQTSFKKKQNTYSVNQAVGDFFLGDDQPGSSAPSASIHTLVDRRGNVRTRYLHVTGSQGADYIRVRSGNSKLGQMLVVEFATGNTEKDIFQTDTFPEFTLDQIDSVRIFGLAGDDTVTHQTSVPDFIYGGLGNDFIRAGHGPSWVFGQDGDDRIDGRAGDDNVYGEDGDDNVAGGDGMDTVIGGPGNDNLVGGDIPWSTEDFSVVEDGDADLLTGGSGADDFYLTNPLDDLITDFNNSEDAEVTE